MENKVTLREGLQMVMDILNNLNIPVKEVQNIGIPVCQAINILGGCIGFVEMKEAEEKKEANESEEKEDA